MSYCTKLSEKLNKWKDVVEELKIAKDNYLASFSVNDKARYQELKEEVKRKEESYRKFKEEECFEVVMINNKEERLFGPEYEALERLYKLLNLQLFEEGEITIKDGRVIKIRLFDLKKDNDTEEIIKKRNLAFSNLKYLKKLQELYCDNNNLQELPTLPDGLQWFDCDNNNLQELPPLPDGLQTLDCSNNNLKELPILPDGLQWLDCSNCPLTEKAKEEILKHKNANNFLL